MPHVEHPKQTQYHVRVPTFGPRQPTLVIRKIHVQ
jgi:hypothetical protein